MKHERMIVQLAEIERHIALGKQHVEHQQALIDELIQSGERAENERALLATFKSVLAQHERRRAQLRHDLKEQPETN